MAGVSTTAFITHCWRKVGPKALLLLMLAWLLGGAGGAIAQTPRNGTLQVREVVLQQRDSAVLLEARLALELPEVVNSALHKGIPIIFVAHARIVRPRWYWRNAVLAEVRRYYRLSYQPLTDRWRLSISAEQPQLGSGLMLGQNFSSMDEALSVMRRVVDWRIGRDADFKSGDVYDVNFGFQLAVDQLPKPLQIGWSLRDDWHMEAGADFRWTPIAEPEAPPSHTVSPASLTPGMTGPNQTVGDGSRP